MSNEGSPYGKAFVIRMLVLLVLLAAAVGGFYYDQELMKTANTKVDEIYALASARTDDGGGIPQSQIRETVGNSARLASREHVREETGKTYEVDTFSFKRVIPFMAATTIDVAYLEKATVYVSKPGEAITDDQLNSGFERPTFTVPEGDRVQPSAGGMGGTGGGGGASRGGGGRRGRPDNDDAKSDDADKDDDSEDSDTKDED
jgi:hypothetical protein